MTLTEVENSFVVAFTFDNGRVAVLDTNGEFRNPNVVKRFGANEKLWKTRSGANAWVIARSEGTRGLSVKPWKEVFS